MEQAVLSAPTTPKAWANRLTRVLNLALGPGPGRFPVDAAALAKDYTRQVFRDEAVAHVDGVDLGGFEGCLRRVAGTTGPWGILYNNGVSPGRARFTVAHEFGHYLLHRHLAGEDGILCSAQDVARGQAGPRDIEREADEFAATLLMPLDDFRRQIPAREAADLHALSGCADRYGTSLLAATLKWLSYTERRAVLVFATDGFVLWSKSSQPAMRTGTFLRSRSGPPVEVPVGSLLARRDMLLDNRAGIRQGPGVWFGEESREMALFADGYDFAMALVMLEDGISAYEPDDEADPCATGVETRVG